MMTIDAIRHDQEMSDNGNIVAVERANFFIRKDEAEMVINARFTARFMLWKVESTETTEMGTNGSARVIKK